MKFNWSWQELCAFAIAVAAGVALLITHVVTWQQLVAFVGGVFAFNRPVAGNPPSGTPKIGEEKP